MSISYIVARFVEIDPKWTKKKPVLKRPHGNPDILTPLVENERGFNTYFLRSEKKIPLQEKTFCQVVKHFYEKMNRN